MNLRGDSPALGFATFEGNSIAQRWVFCPTSHQLLPGIH